MRMRIKIRDTGSSYKFFYVYLLLDGEVIASTSKRNPVACARWGRRMMKNYQKAARIVNQDEVS